MYTPVDNDTIRGAVLTCARKPTWVSLVYQAECLPYSSLLPVYSERLYCTGWRNLLLSRHINNEFVPLRALSEGMVPGPGRAFSCVELMPRPSIDSAATSSHLSAAHPTAAPSCSLSSRLWKLTAHNDVAHSSPADVLPATAASVNSTGPYSDTQSCGPALHTPR